MSTTIYVIKRIWIDSLENEVDSAVGYTEVGYVDIAKEASDIVCSGKRYTKKDCWAIPDSGMPEFMSINIEKYDQRKVK